MPGLFDQRPATIDNGDVRFQLTELKSVVDKLRNMKPDNAALNNASNVLGNCCVKIEKIMSVAHKSVADTPEDSYVNSPSARGG